MGVTPNAGGGFFTEESGTDAEDGAGLANAKGFTPAAESLAPNDDDPKLNPFACLGASELDDPNLNTGADFELSEFEAVVPNTGATTALVAGDA